MAHRELALGHTHSGEDVRALQRALRLRLGARGEEALSPKVDGRYGPATARAAARALYLLGALGSTHQAAKVEHGGRLSKGAQWMIRHPERRSAAQLARAHLRMAALDRNHDGQIDHPAAARHASVVELAVSAARLALRHAPQVHYTQGPARWQGIAERLLAGKGQFPQFCDCSSFYSWCMWQGLKDGPDVVNGADWRGGFTGTLLSHGRRVDRLAPGVAALYGHGFPGSHVAIGVSATQVISHGSEGGPFLLPLHYRGDLMELRAYV